MIYAHQLMMLELNQWPNGCQIEGGDDGLPQTRLLKDKYGEDRDILSV
jgi:hypothetical protein